MLGRTVGILCAACAGASALIIPPGVASNHDAPDLSVTILDPKRSTLTVPCGGCAFPMGGEVEEAVMDDVEEEVWIQGGANSLLMDFEVSEDGKALHLNGEPIYPVFSESGETLFDQRPIHVKQVPSHEGLVDVKNGLSRSADLEVTAYGLRQEEGQMVSPNGDKVVPLSFEIMGLNDQFMHVDEVAVTLFQTGDGEFFIMDTEVKPSPVDEMPPPHFFKDGGRPHDGPHDGPHHGPYDGPHDIDDHPHHGPPHHFKQGNHKECSFLPSPLCKLKNIMEDKIDMAMGVPPQGPRPHGFRKGGCKGRKGKNHDGQDDEAHGKHLPGHIKGPRPHHADEFDPEHRDFKFHGDMEDLPEPSRPHHGRPHHGRPHGEHHHPHHDHKFFPGHHFVHAFLKGLVAVLIPVMAGITVGMTVSLVGLVVGRVIGFVWIQLARGGRRGSASVALRDDVQEVIVVEEGGEEKKALLVEMDAAEEAEALPVYEDAPAYVEVVEEEK